MSRFLEIPGTSGNSGISTSPCDYCPADMGKVNQAYQDCYKWCSLGDWKDYIPLLGNFSDAACYACCNTIFGLSGGIMQFVIDPDCCADCCGGGDGGTGGGGVGGGGGGVGGGVWP
jgi:hypothetical protein